MYLPFLLLFSWVLFFHFCILDLILKILIILSFASFSFSSKVMELLRSSWACLETGRPSLRHNIIPSTASLVHCCVNRIISEIVTAPSFCNGKHPHCLYCLPPQPPPRQSWSSHCLHPANQWRPWSLKHVPPIPFLLNIPPHLSPDWMWL